MASIEFLEKRIAGKQKELDKLNKKMTRILAAEASGWTKNPYYYNEHDKERTQREIDRAQKSLDENKEALSRETEKAASRNVKAILDFLEGWKDRMRTYYHGAYERYLVARKEYYAEDERLSKISFHGDTKEERLEAKDQSRKLRRAFHETWNFIEGYETYKGFDDERFEKDIKREAEIKYDNIIERTNDICGKIVDASALRVGAKGDIDGIVIGERGKARIQTIGAGGYNIQCYHFRVLVHKAQ